MRYSVLMSVYNKENPEYFRAALNSIFHQTVPPTEVVLVCDGPLTAALDTVILEYEDSCSKDTPRSTRTDMDNRVTPDGKLICFYSDERRAAGSGYNQLLAHKVSPDGGRTWGEEKIDVAFPGGRLRPGMPVVAALPRGRFIMVYEMVNQDKIPGFAIIHPGRMTLNMINYCLYLHKQTSHVFIIS